MSFALATTCGLVTALVVVILVVLGFIEVFKKKKPSEADQTAVISRQLKGFAFLILAPMVGFSLLLLCGLLAGRVAIRDLAPTILSAGKVPMSTVSATVG